MEEESLSAERKSFLVLWAEFDSTASLSLDLCLSLFVPKEEKRCQAPRPMTVRNLHINESLVFSFSIPLLLPFLSRQDDSLCSSL